MKTSGRGVHHFLLVGSLILSGIVFAPVRSNAQQGNKTVYTTNDNLTPSSAWVDASAFCNLQTGGGTKACAVGNQIVDFCAVLSSALTSLMTIPTPVGGVVDARGVLPIPLNGNLTVPCKSNPFPARVPPSNPYPITILLPPFTIEITSGITWTLPNNVKLIGAGVETVLLGDSGCCSTAMIEMGPTQPCPTTYAVSGIAIEHLQLITNGAFGGIDNECAGASSYVKDVKISGVYNGSSLGGDALTIGSGAVNSGPYSDIYVQVAPGNNTCGNGTGFKCVNINAQTRGLHGITCQGGQQNATKGIAAIVVNGINNSIEDVHLESWYDGIQIGSTTSGTSNVFVSNVEASANGCGAVTNGVHICGAYNDNNNACSAYGPVTDVSIISLSNGPTEQPVTSIQDDATGTTIVGCNGAGCPAPITSGMYFLGRPYGGSSTEYSRFAINPAFSTATLGYGTGTTVVPTWAADTAAGLSGTQCYTPGALYSFTTAGTGSAIYVCTFSGNTTAWIPLPLL